MRTPVGFARATPLRIWPCSGVSA